MNLLFKRSAPFLALLGLALGGCQPDLKDDPKSSAGQADFSRYIAVGNSLTAGYGDNGLYLEGQQNSYPAILAKQFAQVGGGEFVQPLFNGPNQSNGSGYLKITGFTAAGTPTLGSETSNLAVVPGSLAVTPGTPPVTRINLLAKSTVSNQNLGVPGIRVSDVQTAGYGLNNPVAFNEFFERLLGTANAASSYQQYVQERVTTIKPTFFTNWLGNNDVLGYATSGGTGTLTPVADFTTKYTAITDILAAGGAKGLLATIPNVVNVPYFTTVSTPAVMAQISAAPVPTTTVAGLTAALSLTPAQASTIRFGLFVQAISSATSTATVTREATANDLLLLPASSVINTPSTTANPLPRGLGIVITGLSAAQAAGLAQAAPANPLPNSLVLDALEVGNAQSATTAFNAVITNTANQKNLAVFDSNTFFNNLARTGLVINTVSNTAAFVSGNLFSLDGVHPTPRGYALIANEMIKSINSYYGAGIPGVDATAYRGVRFPQ